MSATQKAIQYISKVMMWKNGMNTNCMIMEI